MATLIPRDQLMHPMDYNPNLLPERFLVQRKKDGIFCIIHPDGTLQTRQGKVWGMNIIPQAEALRGKNPRCCELWSPKGGVQRVQELAAVTRTSRHKDIEELRVFLFDEIAPGNYLKRLTFVPEYYSGDIEDDVKEYFEMLVAAGEEGIIIRDAHAPYTPGRSAACMRLKKVRSCEATITGFLRGESGGKFSATLGSLKCSLPDGTEFTCSGMDNSMRDEFFYNRAKYLGATITINYERLSKTGVPLKPRFVAVRNYE
jgi:hypothetical protein